MLKLNKNRIKQSIVSNLLINQITIQNFPFIKHYPIDLFGRLTEIE